MRLDGFGRDEARRKASQRGRPPQIFNLAYVQGFASRTGT
jgi:hypothetical protein